MQAVYNAVAVLALLGAVLALLAASALLRAVREVQQALVGAAAPASRALLSEFESAQGLDTLVLAVSDRCPSCTDRARRFAGLGASVVDRRVLLGPSDAVRAWVPEGDVEVIVDPVLLGSVAPAVTPTLLRFGPDGREHWRTAVGSDDELVRAVSRAGEGPRSSTTLGA